ncbi:MAG: asparagine synthase-related protein [Armatimonadota bacterium]
MPGLFGIIRFNKDADQADTAARMTLMRESLRHAPEYVVRAVHADGRQSATVESIDLPINHDIEQPVTSLDGAWAGLLYGEVYDGITERRGLRESVGAFELTNDAQYLLELYLARGREALAEVSGSFVAIFVERATGATVILTDRYALRPLYYAVGDGELIFAPEIKAVLAAKPQLRRRIDPVGVGEFLSIDYPLGDRTLFDAIRVFPPAAEGRVGESGLSTTTYWSIEFGADPELQTREAQRDAVAAAFREQISHIALHRTDGLRVGALLSGGMDSRALVGLVAPHRQIVTHHFGIGGCPETPWAEAVAAACGAEYHVHEIIPDRHPEHWPGAVWLTEGMVCCFHFHHSHLVEPIAATCDVLLNGLTTLFSGAIKSWMLRPGSEEGLLERYRQEMMETRPPLQELLPAAMAGGMGPAELEQAMAEHFTGLMNDCRQATVPDWCERFYIRNRQRRLLSYATNMHATRMRVKTPFYGNTLVDTVLRLPAEARIGRRAYIDALWAVMPELAAIPCSTDLSGGPGAKSSDAPGRLQHFVRRVANKLRYEGNRLAPNLVPPAATSYPPYGPLLRTLWRDRGDRLFLAEDAALFEYVNRDTVRDAWLTHLHGRSDHGHLLHRLFALELWHSMFVEQRTPDELSEW